MNKLITQHGNILKLDGEFVAALSVETRITSSLELAKARLLAMFVTQRIDTQPHLQKLSDDLLFDLRRRMKAALVVELL